MYAVIGYYKFIPSLWALYSSFLFLFFDGVVEISPFGTLRIDRITNVDTFLLSLSSLLPFFLILTSVYILILRVESYCLPWSHSETDIHSVWLLWTRDRPVTEPSTWQHDIHKRQTLVTPVGFKPTVPSNVRPQTYAIVCAATGISFCRHYTKNIKWHVVR
jgi:hypothetical protein